MKTLEEHKADGTYRKDRHGTARISFAQLEEISIPESLNKIAAAKWTEIVPELFQKGLITNVDLPELTDAFVHYGSAQECLIYITENFETVADYLQSLNLCKGQINLFAQYSAAMEYYNKIMHKFGATPAERGKIRVHEEKKEDKDDEFIKALMKNGA